MIKADKNLEDVINEAVKCYESGIKIQRILDMHPDYTDELREIFQTIEKLSYTAQDIIPPKKLLDQIISNLDSNRSVTNLQTERYSTLEERKGRASFIQTLNNQIHTLMNINWKIAAPAVVAVLLVVFLVSNKPGSNGVTPPPAGGNQPGGSIQIGQPATSGNVDDVTNSMLSASSGEEAALKEELSSEESLYNSEDAALSDFGQSYNSNDF